MALVALLLGTYAYFYQAGGWNQNSRYNLVRSVVERGTLRVDAYQQSTGDDAIKDGHYYCDKAPGASWLCIPTYAALYHLNGQPNPPPADWLAWTVWLAIVLAIAVPSVIAALFMVRLAGQLGMGPRTSILIALSWGFATMALPYSTLLYGGQLSGSLMIIAFALLVEIRRGAAPTARRMFAIGALLGYAGATEYPAVLIAAPISLYGLAVAGWRPSRWAIVGGLIPLAALLWYHDAAFGSPFAFPYDYSVFKERHIGWFMGVGTPRRAALHTILIGDRGLLTITPWLALALPGAMLIAHRHRWEIAVCVWAAISTLWLNASLPPTDGGWSPGPRYLVPMLPFVAVLVGGVAAGITARWRSQRVHERGVGIAAAVALAALLLISSANMFAATAVKPEIDTAWKRAYAQFVWPNFLAGRLSVSTQSIEMPNNPRGSAPQAWNLGMKAGLTGHASLVPLYLWIAACGLGLAWTLRRRPAPRAK